MAIDFWEKLNYTEYVMENIETKYDNKYLLERQLEMLKIFLEKKIITQEQYNFEVETLTTRIKTEEEK